MMMTKESYHVSRYRSSEMERRLSTILPEQSYDFVQIESSHLLIYYDLISRYHSGKIVLRAHNVEHQIWQRYQSQLENSIVSKYHHVQANRLHDIEEQYAAKLDGILTVSEVDKVYFSGLNQRSFTIPIGLDMPSASGQLRKTSSPTYGFIGSMDWSPNIEGLRWLFDKVIAPSDSAFRMVLAGRNFEAAKLTIPSQRNIKILGEIEDVNEFWNQIDVLMVPLFSGSGTRVKIIEAFTHQKLVLTTSIGIEGIPANDGEHAVIRDREDDWARAIDKIIDDWPAYNELQRNGRKLAEKHYEYRQVGKAAMEIYQQLTSTDPNQV